MPRTHLLGTCATPKQAAGLHHILAVPQYVSVLCHTGSQAVLHWHTSSASALTVCKDACKLSCTHAWLRDRNWGHCCRYIMTIKIDGSNLWRVPSVSGEPAGLDYGTAGKLLVSENSTTYLVQVGKDVQKLSKPPPVAKTEAGPCKFYPNNNRSGHTLGSDSVCTTFIIGF